MPSYPTAPIGGALDVTAAFVPVGSALGVLAVLGLAVLLLMQDRRLAGGRRLVPGGSVEEGGCVLGQQLQEGGGEAGLVTAFPAYGDHG